jgi:hypothetical protein
MCLLRTAESRATGFFDFRYTSGLRNASAIASRDRRRAFFLNALFLEKRHFAGMPQRQNGEATRRGAASVGDVRGLAFPSDRQARRKLDKMDLTSNEH